VRAIGQLPQTANVQRESDEDRLVANIALGTAPTTLSAVRVQANRAPAGPPGGFRPEPGNTSATSPPSRRCACRWTPAIRTRSPR
jgi:hypothetical protein